MPTRHATALWEGTLAQGRGAMEFDAYQGQFSFASRMESGPGTNPEELLGAAHAGCFSMALAAALLQAGHRPDRIRTTAAVHFGPDGGGGFQISHIELATEAEITGIGDTDFQDIAADAKSSCPDSKALAATRISLPAKLLPGDSLRLAG